MIFSRNEDWPRTSRPCACELDANPPDATMHGRPLWQDYLPEAWAAIMAIREPDPAMIGAGAHKAAEGQSEDIGEIYRAMIDAAMEGQPNAPSDGAQWCSRLCPVAASQLLAGHRTKRTFALSGRLWRLTTVLGRWPFNSTSPKADMISRRHLLSGMAVVGWIPECLLVTPKLVSAINAFLRQPERARCGSSASPARAVDDLRGNASHSFGSNSRRLMPIRL